MLRSPSREAPTLPWLRRKGHVVSLALVTLVVIAVGGASTLDWNEYSQNATLARHARAILQDAQSLLTSLETVDAARLGYLLTGDGQYLADIETARSMIARNLAELSRPDSGLTDGATLERVKDLVGGKLNDVMRDVALRRSTNHRTTPDDLPTYSSRQRMDAIRTLVLNIIADENKIFTASSTEARRHSARTRLIVLCGTILLAVLLVGANVHIHGLFRTQDRLIEELETAHGEEARAKSAFETTLESIGEAVISVDTNGRVLFFNSAAEKVTGWRRADAIGTQAVAVFPVVGEDSLQPLDNPAAAVIKSGAALSLQHPVLLQTRDHAQVPIDFSAAPVYNRQGETAGAVIVFRDVTPRLEAQRRMAESEQRYRLLFEANPEPMWVYDVETLGFLEVNNSAVQHYGFSRDEFLGMTLRDIRPPEDVAEMLRDVARRLTIRHTDGPYRHRKKDGTVIAVEITAHPLVFNGRDARFILVHDITQRAQLEEQLRQSQKLEAVGRLAGGVAHDFNNLLTVISGYAEMLDARVAADEEAQEAVAEIVEGARRAAALTQQLLAFSRRQVLQPRILNLNDSVRDMQKMLGRLLGEDIELRTVLAPDLWETSADPGQIDQILMNLAVNARDAMPGGGTLTVTTANAALGDDYVATHIDVTAGEYVTLSVADTGHGMDAATKARVFEPFFTTKGVGGGTGLGLSTVYGIVKQSGGNIWVYSEPGRGSTFAVYLPRATTPIAAVPPAAASSVSPADPDRTVLMVEDDPSVRKMISAMLKSSGYRVLTAESAEEALRHCADAGRIDLLLCDMVLPRTDGPTIAREVVRLRPDIIVLFMSGYTEHPVLQQQGAHETASFIQKPFTREALAQKILSLFNPVS